MQGDQKKFSAAARQRAVKYLERQLPKIRDSYELAITAYALAVTGSAETDLAFGKLTQVRFGFVLNCPLLSEDNRRVFSNH